MQLEPLEIGVLFWAKPDARQTFQEVKKFGLRAGQIGFPGNLPLDGAADNWRSALSGEAFTLVTAVCSYDGEMYSDIPTVEATVGLIPESTRAQRVARTKAVSDVAKILGIDSIACHIGVVPADTASLRYRQVVDLARNVCDHCGANGQRFTLETGQEPADELLRFIADVKRDNLKINFDPANMVLYGSDDPIEALRTLAPHVISVHCKDGEWPPEDQPGALGLEVALGEGEVGIDIFVHTLREVGYQGILSIEREFESAEQRRQDIISAIKLLKWLTGRD